MPPPGPPRTLTQMLRGFDEPALLHLLHERPDVTAEPAPVDFPQVAARVTERQSVIDAARRLHAFDAWVARQSCRLDGLVTSEAVAAFGADRADVAASLDRLRALALVWGAPDALRPVRALAALHQDADEEPAPSSSPPPLDDLATVSAGSADKVGAGSAFEVLQHIDVVVEHCDHSPMTLTRDDEPTRKVVRQVAGRLEMPMGPTTTLIEVCRAARLLGPTPQGTGQGLAPSDEFDRWSGLPLGQQWEHVVSAWMTHHAPSGPPWLKRICLDAFGERGSGRVLTHEAMKLWLAWWRPQRPVSADRQSGVFLETAAMLGVTGRGALTTYAHDRDVARLEALLPERIDHVIVQADLTAVAPGPLTAEAMHDLGQLADLESRGGATVYRFSSESLRRAVGLGWTADEVLDVLRQRSTTSVPQPLEYLVRDAARQAGRAAPAASTGHHEAPRAPTPEAEVDPEVVDDAAVHEVVAALLDQGDAQPRPSTEPARGAGSAIAGDTVSVLREAGETGEVVWIGYVDATGASRERLVKVTAVDDGELHATDTRTGDLSRLPVHRITAAHIIRTTP